MLGLSNMVTPKIEREAEARNYGKFVISPLEHGYGITLGNALRRVLLSSLDGVAVTSIRIADVLHEFLGKVKQHEPERIAKQRELKEQIRSVITLEKEARVRAGYNF